MSKPQHTRPVKPTLERVVGRWRKFWLWRGGYDRWGKLATRLASLGAGSYRQLYLKRLAWIAPPRGYIHPSAEIIGVELRRGAGVFIGERVVIARWQGNGFVELGDGAHINRECCLELWAGGHIYVGPEAGIQPRSLLVAAVQPISIGRRAQIASYCSLFPYDHSIAPDRPIYEQPAFSKGPIVIEEDAWLGVGVTVLSGVTIGEGAVVGAGSVVTSNIPAGAIAVGTPARVVKHRHQLKPSDLETAKGVAMGSAQAGLSVGTGRGTGRS